MTPDRPTGIPPLGGMSIPLGVWLLGRGRAVGINCFSPGVQPLMAALAPTIAITLIELVSVFLLPADQRELQAIRALVQLVCPLLQLIVSERYAVFVGRKGLWTRYATASLWCAWLPVIMMIMAEGIMRIIMPAAASSSAALAGVAVGVWLYSLWLTWYVTRVGLVMTAWQATIMTVLQTVSVFLLIGLLLLVPPHYNAIADLFGA